MEILFFRIKQKIFLKDDVILIAKFKEITGPFILGKLAQHLKRTSRKVKISSNTDKKASITGACEQLQKFGEHEQASTRLNFASKSSTGKI